MQEILTLFSGIPLYIFIAVIAVFLFLIGVVCIKMFRNMRYRKILKSKSNEPVSNEKTDETNEQASVLEQQELRLSNLVEKWNELSSFISELEQEKRVFEQDVEVINKTINKKAREQEEVKDEVLKTTSLKQEVEEQIRKKEESYQIEMKNLKDLLSNYGNDIENYALKISALKTDIDAENERLQEKQVCIEEKKEKLALVNEQLLSITTKIEEIKKVKEEARIKAALKDIANNSTRTSTSTYKPSKVEENKTEDEILEELRASWKQEEEETQRRKENLEREQQLRKEAAELRLREMKEEEEKEAREREKAKKNAPKKRFFF